MKAYKGIFALCTHICISSPNVDENVVPHLYEMSKSLMKILTEIACTCTQNIHMRTGTHPLTRTSVLMSFSSGEDKSKGASPSSQKNQLLLHELLRCLPSVSLQKKNHCSAFPPPTHSAFTFWYHDLQIQILTYKSLHSFNDIYITVF